MWEKIEKTAKIVYKSENLCNKIQFTKFLLLNIVDQIFKISKIVETLVTVIGYCSNSVVVGVKGEIYTKKAKIFKAHPSCPRKPLST